MSSGLMAGGLLPVLLVARDWLGVGELRWCIYTGLFQSAISYRLCTVCSSLSECLLAQSVWTNRACVAMHGYFGRLICLGRLDTLLKNIDVDDYINTSLEPLAFTYFFGYLTMNISIAIIVTTVSHQRTCRCCSRSSHSHSAPVVRSMLL